MRDDRNNIFFASLSNARTTLTKNKKWSLILKGTACEGSVAYSTVCTVRTTYILTRSCYHTIHHTRYTKKHLLTVWPGHPRGAAPIGLLCGNHSTCCSDYFTLFYHPTQMTSFFMDKLSSGLLAGNSWKRLNGDEGNQEVSYASLREREEGET